MPRSVRRGPCAVTSLSGRVSGREGWPCHNSAMLERLVGMRSVAMTLEAADFTAFVRAHSRSLYGTAYLLTGNPDAAEDLLQDTLAALFPKWTRVAAAEQPVAYVRRALANRFISASRRRSGTDVAIWELPDGPADLDV